MLNHEDIIFKEVSQFFSVLCFRFRLRPAYPLKADQIRVQKLDYFPLLLVLFLHELAHNR